MFHSVTYNQSTKLNFAELWVFYSSTVTAALKVT